MKAKEYGIPQARERMVIIGAQKDFNFEQLLEKAKSKIDKNIPTSHGHHFETDELGECK